MINRKQLKALSSARLGSTKYLCKHGDYDGAAYFLGYVVEFALKAVICKRLNLLNYPDFGPLSEIFKTHDFNVLLTLSGMSDKININGELKLWENWSKLTQWRPDIRYDPLGTYTEEYVEERIDALENKQCGLLIFVKKHKKW